MPHLLLLVFACLCLAPQRLAAASDASPRSAYAQHLPRAALAEILPALRAALDAAGRNPALTLVSAESSPSAAEPIVNRISFSSTSRYDLYLMRQRQTLAEGDDPAHWSLLAIIVDRRAMPQMAYYLEFAPEPVKPHGLPQPIAPRVPCYRCHANGPRTIRPLRSPLVSALTRDQLALMRAWNNRMQKSGIIATYEPPSGLLRQRGALANETLRLPFCYGCHNSAKGVRSALLRQHIGSSTFLVAHGRDRDGYAVEAGEVPPFMPLDDQLSTFEQTCLNTWLHAHPLDPTCLAQPSAADEPRQTTAKADNQAASSEAFTVDSRRSHLEVQVATTTGGFVAAGFTLKGAVATDRCGGQLSVDTAGAATGIRVRDLHMHSQILAEVGPITLSVAPQHCATLLDAMGSGRQQTVPVQVRFHAVRREVPVLLRAAAGGTEISAALDLRAFGVEPPSFLTLAVQPVLNISGTLFRQIDSGGE